MRNMDVSHMDNPVQPAIRKLATKQASRPLFGLMVLLTVFAGSGASCNQWMRSYTQPRTLPEAATLDQIVSGMNGNTGKVQSLQASQATLSLPGAPALRANVAAQTSRRLRLIAYGPLGGGPVLDLGSNDELFWLWIRQGPSPTMFV